MNSIRNRIIENNATPVLTVFCWTYNDSSLISKCIESVLDQITNFPVEIIVHDDASTDGTREILIEYSLKYPGLFKNILNEVNNWSKGINVSIPLFHKPKGKYISLLHGDDYWTDPFKLQKQVNLLEKYSNYSFCFHKVNYVENNIILGNYYKEPINKILNLKQIIKTHYVATSSVVFRKSMLKIPKEIYSQMYFNDICLELFLTSKGQVYYFEEIMGVYRKNSSSISNHTKYLLKGRSNLIKMYSQFRTYLKGQHYFLITLIIIKIKIGFIKDYFGLNPTLKK